MKFGLDNKVIKNIEQVLAFFTEVEGAVLYGSRAKGNFKPGSDIDLTLKGSKLNLALLNSISLKLDELYLPYTFDLSIYHQINNPELIGHIERVGVIFYETQNL